MSSSASPAASRPSFATEPAFVGDSASMISLRALLMAAVAADAPVVLCGERGVGKLRIARWLHDSGRRAAAPLVVVACDALPIVGSEEVLLEPQTGALARAARGTLVLECVDALPTRVQAALMRALIALDGVSSEARPRIISTVLETPTAAIRAGRLREDLRFRLGVFTVAVPALRERREDLLALVDDVVRQACLRRGRGILTVSAATREQVLAHHWPGNVSELEACVEAALDDHDDVDNDTDDEDGLDITILAATASLFSVEIASVAVAPTLAAIELRYIHHVLRLVGGNKTRAAEILQVDRRTLYRRLARQR